MASICIISKMFVRCLCSGTVFFSLFTLLSMDFVIWKIPKDIPLFAYINKTSEFSYEETHKKKGERLKEMAENWKEIELNWSRTGA